MASSLAITFLWAALSLDSARNGPPSYAGGGDLSYFSLHGVAAAKPRVRPLTANCTDSVAPRVPMSLFV